MAPLGFHLVFRALGSRIIAPDVVAQRALATTVHAVAEGRGLLAFRASGDHLRLVAQCDRAAAGRIAQGVGSALTQRLGLPGFTGVHLEPLADQSCVESVLLDVLRGAGAHQVSNDPTHEASSIGGLLGLRLVPEGFLPRVRRVSPRLRRGQLLDVLGVAALEPVFQLDQLADAAAGAVGLARLDRSVLASRARAAAVRVATSAPLQVVAERLGWAERTARRARSAPVDPLLERAIGLRMALVRALGDRALPNRPFVGDEGRAGRR